MPHETRLPKKIVEVIRGPGASGDLALFHRVIQLYAGHTVIVHTQRFVDTGRMENVDMPPSMNIRTEAVQIFSISPASRDRAS